MAYSYKNINKESYRLQAFVLRAVLFEVSCRPNSRKSVTLIKVNLGKVCLIQRTKYLLLLSTNKSNHKRLALQNRSFDNFNKNVEKICEEVCLL